MPKKENEKLVPNLRFKGFTDDWIQEKLGNYVTFYSGLTYSPKDVVESGNGTLVLRSSNIQDDRLDFSDNVYVKQEVINSKYVVENDIVVVVRNGSRRLLGKHTIIKHELHNTVIGAFMTGIQANSPYFVNSLLSTTRFKKEMYKDLGATINQITNKSFKNMTFHVPQNEEADNIGDLFKKLDNIIALEQEKLMNYEQVKKNLLSNFFPTSENTIPEIRFKTFSDKWIQRELQDITSITMGQSPSSKNYTDDPNDYILVQGNADLKEGRVSPRIWTKEVTKTAKPGDIILTVRAPVGDVALNDYHVVLGRGVSGIKGSHFVYQLLKRMNMRNYWKRYSTGSTFESINSSDIKTALILVPNESEQEKIGSTLKMIDSIITLGQARIEHYHNIRKNLLQNLFI